MNSLGNSTINVTLVCKHSSIDDYLIKPCKVISSLLFLLVITFVIKNKELRVKNMVFLINMVSIGLFINMDGFMTFDSSFSCLFYLV